MPFVHIELLEGRSYEQKQNLVKDVTEAVVKNTGAAAEDVHIILAEIKHEHLAKSGKLRG